MNPVQMMNKYKSNIVVILTSKRPQIATHALFLVSKSLLDDRSTLQRHTDSLTASITDLGSIGSASDVVFVDVMLSSWICTTSVGG